jgi:cytoskeletal protein CcmA (bactofilin family)
VRAVRKSGRASRKARTRDSPRELPGEKAHPRDHKPTPPAQARIGHTVMPAKYEIWCYECEYTFTMQGRIQDTYCPKCRKPLKVADYTIDKEWKKNIKTIGVLTINQGGVVRDATLIAREIILAGDIEGATVRACRRLELRAGAKFDIKAIELQDLHVASEARISIRRRVVCRNVQVDGTLRAKAYLDGCLTVAEGGSFRGEYHGPRLRVEDGGSLKARIFLGTSVNSESTRGVA